MPYDIGKAFVRIEKELMQSMIRNMERHKAEETKEGFEWAQWQVEQLRALEEYRMRNKKKFPKEFRKINSKIPALVDEARAAGQMDQEADILEAISKGFKARKGSGDITGAFFEVNDRKLNALVEATTNDFERAEVAILRRAEDQYRKVIFDAQVYANAGGTTYEKAVDMATKDFASKGIDCIEYANGARHTLSDYADMAIKTAVKRAYLTGEGEKRQEWGIATVIVNKRGNPCPKCAPFCGKILIDDVWSGGSRKDGRFPLMSTAVRHGLYHPRCRDSHTTYFPGISTAEDKWTKAELKEIEENYEADQRIQYAKRMAEKFERLADTRLDPENKKQSEARAERWKQKSDELTERRKRRQAERNRISTPKESEIQFDDSISDRQRTLIEDLSSQYNTRLQRVSIGAEKAAGDVDVSGARMRLSDKHDNTTIHEFAHTLANTNADKFGLTQDQDFWKEIRKIRREYMKDVEGDPSRWISTYEHSGRSVDEFMAEAFTHAKMRELGLPIPEKYGNDFTYSQQVLDTVNKYFAQNKDLQNVFRGARYKEGFQAKRFEDITGNWFPDAVPGSHSVKKIEKVFFNGEYHEIDGNKIKFRTKPNERRVAELIAKKVGGPVCLRPEINEPTGIPSPDLEINGIEYDVKTLEPGTGKNKIYNRVKKRPEQGGRYIVDITWTDLSDELVDRQIDKIFWSKETQFIDEIVVIRGDDILRVARRK